jgi:tetratricopeptide (TPR) repeat protein
VARNRREKFQRGRASSGKRKVHAADRRKTPRPRTRDLFSSLRSGSVALRQRQQEIAVRAEKAGTALAQAESDMAAAGSNSLAVLILLLITFIMPFIGIFFSGLNSSNNSSTFSQKAPPAPPAPPPPLHGEGRTVISKAPLGQADVDSDVPDESITDKKIAEMSLADKQFYANVLFRQAGNLKYGEEKNLAAAETKLRFALRFDSENPLILNELADTLYEQKKYSEAIEFLERLLNEEPAGNAAAQIRLARSYIQTKQSGKARDILIDVTANDASSFEGYYNLGLAYKGLKDYYAAEGAFREAVRINPSDAESHYELGYSYYKQGKILDAAQEYKTLLGLDEELAERLKKEAKF